MSPLMSIIQEIFSCEDLKSEKVASGRNDFRTEINRYLDLVLDLVLGRDGV